VLVAVFFVIIKLMRKQLLKSCLIVLAGVLIAGILVFTSPQHNSPAFKVPTAQAQALAQCPTVPPSRADIILLVDLSGSMHTSDVARDGGGNITRLLAVKIALVGCGNGVDTPDCPAGLPSTPRTGFIDEFNLTAEGDRIALIEIKGDLTPILRTQLDQGAVENTITGAINGMGTNNGLVAIGNALNLAGTEYVDRTRADITKRAVIILADGDVPSGAALAATNLGGRFANPAVDIHTIAFGTGVSAANLAKLALLAQNDGQNFVQTSLAGLQTIYSQIVAQLVVPSALDFDNDQRFPIYCAGTAVCGGGPCTDYYNKPSDWPQWDTSDDTDNDLLSLFRDSQVSSGDLDKDGEGASTSTMPQSYLDAGVLAPGQDKDDRNQYVRPNIKEGCCNVVEGRCEPSGGVTCGTTSDTWTLGDRQYASCTDYYVDDPSQQNLPSGCVVKDGISGTDLNDFYACNDRYLSSEEVRSLGAIAIDNNQLPGGNKAEPSCPKEGGLVPCGRYADDPTTANIDESKPCGFCDFFILFDRILKWFFALAIIVGGGMITFGGFTLATSAGNPTRTSLGKNILIYTFLGYAMMLIAWIGINSVFTGIDVKKWTGLRGESGSFESINVPRTTITDTDRTGPDAWEADEWNDFIISIRHPSWSDAEKRAITANTTDSITVNTALPAGAASDMTYKIGGWWQFSCGR